jgi:hypothetical protein
MLESFCVAHVAAAVIGAIMNIKRLKFYHEIRWSLGSLTELVEGE